MCGIYAIYFNDDGDFNEKNIVYIGQSINIEKRMKQHERSMLFDDYPLIDGLYSCINRSQGWASLTWKVLEECSVKELDNKEQIYIQKFLPQLLNHENQGKRRALYDQMIQEIEDFDDEMEDYYWSYVMPH